jgi:hypothetical protein
MRGLVITARQMNCRTLFDLFGSLSAVQLVKLLVLHKTISGPVAPRRRCLALARRISYRGASSPLFGDPITVTAY